MGLFNETEKFMPLKQTAKTKSTLVVCHDKDTTSVVRHDKDITPVIYHDKDTIPAVCHDKDTARKALRLR